MLKYFELNLIGLDQREREIKAGRSETGRRFNQEPWAQRKQDKHFPTETGTHTCPPSV